ncbi:MAG: site-2 protease family protein [Cyanobacteria bacterium P01_D01_bin.105]
MITALLLVAAIAILYWGYSKAQPLGKTGILAWLQTVVLMGPWLLFFGLSAVGLYLNVAGILALVVLSAGVYIYLGRQLRLSAQAELSEKQSAMIGEPANSTLTTADVMAESAVEDDLKSAVESDGKNDDLNSGGALQATGEAVAVKPSSAVKTVSEKRSPIAAEDVAVIEGIFGIDTFFRTKTISFQEGAIFKGNLRGDPAKVTQTLSDKLSEKFGETYRLCLLSDPDDKPVVLVQPSETGPQPTSVRQKILCVVLAIATFATCLETSGILQGFDVFRTPERLTDALPIALGLMAILCVHDTGHWLVANRLDVKTSPPFFFPAWQLGSFGSFMRFESILSNRSVLFDVAFAGPAAGGLLSFGFLFLGLVFSHPGSVFQLPATFFQGSILVGTLARAVLGEALQNDLVDVHPLMVLGWMGLIITAINVLPAGQLDGGRMVQAIYGRKMLMRSTTITVVLLTLVGLFNPLALYWAVLVLFLQRQPERPCQDDLTEPDDVRAALTLLSLLLTLLVLLPLTPSLAIRFGIG